jgi:uncharacterized membrane protein
MANAKEPDMKAVLSFAFGLILLVTSAAQAECYADYKAKKDKPLRLIYGVSQVSDANCDPGAAGAELAPRLDADGWTLLTVLSTFGPEGLEERKANAGRHYLRH